MGEDRTGGQSKESALGTAAAAGFAATSPYSPAARDRWRLANGTSTALSACIANDKDTGVFPVVDRGNYSATSCQVSTYMKRSPDASWLGRTVRVEQGARGVTAA